MNDDERETIRQLFGEPADRPPHDVVPGQRLTREALQQMNDATGQPVAGTESGEIVCDLNGIPIAVAPAKNTRSVFAGVVITEADAERLGYTPEQFPNVRVMPNPRKKDQR